MKIITNNTNTINIKREGTIYHYSTKYYRSDSSYSTDIYVIIEFKEEMLKELEEKFDVKTFGEYIYEKYGIDDPEILWEEGEERFQQILGEFKELYEKIELKVDDEIIEEIKKQHPQLEIKGNEHKYHNVLNYAKKEFYIRKDQISQLESFIKNYE